MKLIKITNVKHTLTHCEWCDDLLAGKSCRKITLSAPYKAVYVCSENCLADLMNYYEIAREG